MVDRDKLTVLMEPYAAGSASDALPDEALLYRLRSARRRLSGELRPVDPPTARQIMPEATYLITRKADGEFSGLYVGEDEAFLVNPGGTLRVGLPLLDEALARLAPHAPCLLLGELVWAPPDGGRERVHDVVRVARRPRERADLDRFRFVAFDLLEEKGAPVDEPLNARWERLTTLLGDAPGTITVAEGGWGPKKEALARFMQWGESEGAEGVVARSVEAGGFKIKARHTLDLAVLGFTMGSDDRVDLLHDLLVAVLRTDGQFHVAGRVGGGFSEEQRATFAATLADLRCESDFLETNSEQVAYQMVRPEWVIEVEVLDFLTETSTGLTIERMVVDYDADRQRFVPVRRMPLGSLISPLFLRRREDKAVHPSDVSIRQLVALHPVDRAEATADDLALPKTERLRREVWVKTLGGGRMVRKILLLRTNKDAVAAYPRYVVYGTDFSPNRKEPLGSDVLVTNDLPQAERLYESLRETYVKRGWVPVEERAVDDAKLVPDVDGDLPY